MKDQKLRLQHSGTLSPSFFGISLLLSVMFLYVMNTYSLLNVLNHCMVTMSMFLGQVLECVLGRETAITMAKNEANASDFSKGLLQSEELYKVRNPPPYIFITTFSHVLTFRFFLITFFEKNVAVYTGDECVPTRTRGSQRA